MITDSITVSADGKNMEEALDQALKMAVYKKLSPKNALHLRLLAEEMMGMMRSITGDADGQFWIEDKDGNYALHLKVDTVMDAEKRKQLLAAATSGKNEASRTLTGRLREFFFRSADEDIASYNSPLLAAGAQKVGNMPVTDWQWSLTRYQSALSDMKEKMPEASDAWDELEKSVVSRVADDVKISIKGWETEMIILKKLA